MGEVITLDPPAVASADRTELNLNSGSIQIREGVDWGASPYEPYMADLAMGEVPVDFRVPSREIRIPLILRTVGGDSFDAARSLLQAKAALFQREGGWLKRVLRDGRTFYADITSAVLSFSGGNLPALKDVDVECELILTAIPDFYEAEEDLGDNIATTNAELIFLETGAGDYPSRVRMVVDEDVAAARRGLIWAFRSRHYSAAATAALRYEAEALTPLDSAAINTITGASGGGTNNVLRHSNLGTSWTPVMNTNLLAGTFLTHTGSYRLFARVYVSAGVKLRCVYDVGDLVLPEENALWESPGSVVFYIADLGEIRLDAAPVGTHRWQGQIQAKGAVGGEDVNIDKLWLVPLDEGMGILRASTSNSSIVADSGRDAFNQTTGALTGKSPDVGAAWAVIAGSDADDFEIDATNHYAQRTAVSDADLETGRYLRQGASQPTAVAAELDVKGLIGSLGPDLLYRGIFLRLVDANNWVSVVLVPGYATTVHMRFLKRVAGVVTRLADFAPGGYDYADNRIKAEADAMGNLTGSRLSASGVVTAAATVSDSDLATGGALASGYVGIYDAYTSASALTRQYDNFRWWVPLNDAVMHASQSAQLTSEGMFREDVSGTAYGPVSHREGPLPRMPGGGRTVECFLKASVGDFDSFPDSSAGDNTSARIFRRKSWLFVPGA